MTGTDEGRSGRDRDWTDAESEGVPGVDDPPPGIDADTAVDGTALPAGRPVGSTERGVTALEESLPESVAQRAARERPDQPQVAPRTPTGRLAVGAEDDDDPSAGEWSDDAAGLSAEEAAVHLDEG